MTPDILLDRAVRCGEWIIRNQITDRQDANRGRGIRSYDMHTGEKVLTGNWMSGHIATTLCALWKRTGNDEYLRRAELAGRYIMSLQVMEYIRSMSVTPTQLMPQR